MVVGLQGAGKTTFAISWLINSRRKNANQKHWSNYYRPAAIDQLKALGQQIDVPVFARGTEVPAVEIVRQRFLGWRTGNHNDYVLIDTAGHL